MDLTPLPNAAPVTAAQDKLWTLASSPFLVVGEARVTAAATKAKPGSTAEAALKSFFSEAHQKDKNKPYDSPMTQEEWEGMTGK